MLYDIVDTAYEVSCDGARGKDKAPSKTREEWITEAKRFADIGLKMSTTIYGDVYSQTLLWKKRLMSQKC